MSISSLNTTHTTPTTTTPSLPAAPHHQQQQSNVTVDSIPNTVNVNSITTQLIKSKELTKSSDLLKIKVTNIRADSTDDSATSTSNVLTAAKLNNNLMKSKIMTSTGSIQICLTQPNVTNSNQATTPTTLQTLTLQTPKSILITPNAQSNSASNSFSIGQAIKFNNSNTTSGSTPINVQSGHTATILNVLNESNNTQPSVIKAIQFNPPNYIPIPTATTPTTPTHQFNPILDGSIPITAPTSVPIVNLPNRKLNSTIKTNNIIKPTVVSGNSNNINHIVKNLIHTSSSSQATANAQAAVHEAAKIFMNEQNHIPQTTTFTLNSINSITSNGSKILSTNLQLVDDSNQNSNSNHTMTRNLNVPSITSANKIVLSTNPNVQKTLPLNLKTNQSNGNSPVSFVLDNNQCNIISNSKTRTIITNSTTPPPPNSMITISSSQVSNFIKTANNTNTNNSTNNNNILSIPTNINSLNSSMYKTIPTSNQFLSNMVNLNNQTTSTTSQTIAQLCSGLNVQQHQMNQPSIISSIIQPIRLIANHQTNTNYNRTNHVNNNFLNPIQINSIQNYNSQSNSVNTLNANLQQQQQQNNLIANTASPTSSPVKPNIIRKPRRDSPSSSNPNNEQILNMPQVYHGQHTIKEIKHPIFDLSNQQDSNGSKIISLTTLPIPTTFISQQPTVQQQQQQTSQFNTVNLTNTEPQVLTYATTSTTASSSKAAINLNQTDDLNKNVRKFQINTQATAATSSSSASSSAPTSSSSSSTNEQQAAQLEQKEDLLNQQTARKRRKQEFIRKPHLDEPALNSPFCPNRYLNENTNISNSTSSSTTQKLNKKINKILKNDLKYGDFCDEDLNEHTRSSIDEDEPHSKHTKLDSIKHKKLNNDNDEDDYLDDDTVQLLSKEFSYVASNGVKWVTKKRSNKALSQLLKPGYDARKNHFVYYSDIKQEQDDDLDTKKASSSTKITPKELIENLNEWKFHFSLSQVKNLMNYENESLDVINEMENLMQNSNFKNYSDVGLKINESIKANSQRHKFVNEQLDEAQTLIRKLFDSKDKFKNVMLLSASPSTEYTHQACQSSAQLDSLLSAHLNNQCQPKTHHNLKKQFKNKNSINTRSNIQKSTFKQSK